MSCLMTIYNERTGAVKYDMTVLVAVVDTDRLSSEAHLYDKITH